MKDGLYEKVVTKKFKESLRDKEYRKTRNIDDSELARTLSTEYQKGIRERLLQMDKKVDREFK